MATKRDFRHAGGSVQIHPPVATGRRSGPPKKPTVITTLELTETDPVARLVQLCSQTGYHHRFSWDKFSNGVMCDVELLRRDHRRTLWREAHFVETTDVAVAQKVVSVMLLDHLGLSPPEPAEEVVLPPPPPARSYAEAAGRKTPTPVVLEVERSEPKVEQSEASGEVEAVSDGEGDDDADPEDETDEPNRKDDADLPKKSWADMDSESDSGEE